jgi:hypothetical protein
LSTLAIDGSDRLGQSRGALLIRFADLIVLVSALPVFLIAGLPMLGYGVCAGAWLLASGMAFAADRHAKRAIARGDRRAALGGMAAATLGRVWIVALAILLVGLADRESGLAAALLAVALVTVHLAGMALSRLLEPPEAEG